MPPARHRLDGGRMQSGVLARSNAAREGVRARRRSAGFTLLEILISLAVLTFGLLALLTILQRALKKSEPVEFETRAALLAQSILEGIKSDPSGFPFIPGVNPGTWPVIEKGGAGPDQPVNSIYSRVDSLLLEKDGKPFDVNRATGMKLPFIFSIPGDGVDNDAFARESIRYYGNEEGPFTDERGLLPGDPPDGIDDLMFTRLAAFSGRAPGIASKRDYDGGIQEDVSRVLIGGPGGLSPNFDVDRDGIPYDTGDSASALDPLTGILRNTLRLIPDGDFSYDPQRGIDEELPDGLDNDGDGLVDEDLKLASQRLPGFSDPDDFNPYHYVPTLPGNGLDDDRDSDDWKDTNKSGAPDAGDEGIDPTTGLVMADGHDNDGDGFVDENIDEEFYDGVDDINEHDGRIDEDCRAAMMPYQPMPFPAPNDEYSWQISVRRVPVGGNGSIRNEDPRFLNGDRIDNDGDGRIDEEYFNGHDDDLDGFIDEDLQAYPAPNLLLVTVFIFQGDDRQDNDGDTGDGWIDEELLDKIDNDRDGLTDEDLYRRVFRTTALVHLPER